MKTSFVLCDSSIYLFFAVALGRRYRRCDWGIITVVIVF